MATEQITVQVDALEMPHLKAMAESKGKSLEVYACLAIRERLLRDTMQQLHEDGYAGLSHEEIAESELAVEQALEEERREARKERLRASMQRLRESGALDAEEEAAYDEFVRYRDAPKESDNDK
ncbi:hypothetical protein [Microbispora sp. GKU 823]|uniref:hypothetical protein n=1 Tax=Microbispora sp. GKU 823 TaxID=1652100 RepID=UPI0009A32CD4|nr:hypothetical protein [Microbispora sp. GKU 823]OPG09294.1 hypothetical protein B1L11_26160 [Microbispora sp. GKU 823]